MTLPVHDLHSLIPRTYMELGLDAVELLIPISHAISPVFPLRTYVELGLDVVHGLGYHAARRAHLPLNSGIYLARTGYVFESLGCEWGSLITSVLGPAQEVFSLWHW